MSEKMSYREKIKRSGYLSDEVKNKEEIAKDLEERTNEEVKRQNELIDTNKCEISSMGRVEVMSVDFELVQSFC
ncbi:hypothetical protein TPENAI_60904 [Tenacibaculum litopenaei]|uniref:hypothetical protein n=1 Tax=Tenacibaculum litopenaei TaxID=396016 RepID=UPI0038936E61